MSLVALRSNQSYQSIIMPHYSKIIVLLVIMVLFAGYDAWYLTAVDHVRIYNVIFEFSFALMSMTLFLLIDSLKGKRFYHFLNLGFLLVFISMYVDGLDQFYLHGEMYTAFAEKATMFIGFVFLFVGIYQWIVEYGHLNQKLERQAFTDELTGLYNRRGMMKKFEALDARAKAEQKHLSFIIADLDDFKEFNDTFGHLSGDRFLADLGKRLMSMMQPGQVIGRWGGEEFAICLLDSDLAAAQTIAESIRVAVSNMQLPDVREHKTVTVSMGVSQKAPNEHLMDAIKRADRSLYIAKNQGKNASVAA